MTKGSDRESDDSKRQERLTREAIADVDEGRLVSHEAVLAWAESLGTRYLLSVPYPRTR